MPYRLPTTVAFTVNGSKALDDRSLSLGMLHAAEVVWSQVAVVAPSEAFTVVSVQRTA